MSKAYASLLLTVLLVALLVYGLNVLQSPRSQTYSQTPGIQVLFCPEDGCSDSLIQIFDRANETIDVAVYSFTHSDIAEALVRAKGRGVRVRVILESEQLTSYSQYGKLKSAGVEVVIDRNEYLMHNKFAVIDGKVVVTGSFNYTVAADRRNDENLIMIFDEGVAGKYEAEFEEMWSGVYGR